MSILQAILVIVLLQQYINNCTNDKLIEYTTESARLMITDLIREIEISPAYKTNELASEFLSWLEKYSIRIRNYQI